MAVSGDPSSHLGLVTSSLQTFFFTELFERKTRALETFGGASILSCSSRIITFICGGEIEVDDLATEDELISDLFFFFLGLDPSTRVEHEES